MVEVGQGSGIMAEIEETPCPTRVFSAHNSFGCEIGIGIDALRLRYAQLFPDPEGYVPGMAPADGSCRINTKALFDLKGGTYFRESNDRFSTMDVQEIQSDFASLGLSDLASSVAASDSAYLGVSGVLRTNPLTSSTGRPSSNTTKDYNLYLDSGASRHMVCNPALLTNRRERPAGMDKFMAADGACLAVTAFGDIDIEDFKIPDVCLVEGLTLNLISVGQVARTHNISSYFSGNACELLLCDGTTRVGGALLGSDNMYRLKFLLIE